MVTSGSMSVVVVFVRFDQATVGGDVGEAPATADGDAPMPPGDVGSADQQFVMSPVHSMSV